MKLADIRDLILGVPLTNGRRIIAIVGAPASGKSMMAKSLNTQISGSCVLPMDGFHLDNSVLQERGLLARKGAPETFDVAGFEALIRDLRSEKAIPFPTFDRDGDCVVPKGGLVAADHHTILVEGNYLLLDVAPWDRLKPFWDYTIMLNTPVPELETRLVQRWIDQGLTLKAAKARAHNNDLQNAALIQQKSAKAELVIS